MKLAFIALALVGRLGSYSPAALAQVAEKPCPYDLRGGGFTDEQIEAICDEWRKSQPPTGPRTGDGEEFPGQNCIGVCNGQPK